MGVVSFNFVYSNDFNKYITYCNIINIGDKIMNNEVLITHIIMFILGCVTMYMMVNYI